MTEKMTENLTDLAIIIISWAVLYCLVDSKTDSSCGELLSRDRLYQIQRLRSMSFIFESNFIDVYLYLKV